MPAPSFGATSMAGRVLLIIAAGLALIAVVAVSSGLRTKPEHRLITVTRPPDVVVAQDAAGCPVTGACHITSGVPTALISAVQRQFPRAVAQWQSSTADQAAPQRLTALFLLNGDADTLFVNAECQPGSTKAQARRESSSAQQRSDLAGNQVAELTIREIVVPGAGGCTSDLILNAIGDGFRYENGMQALAKDPAIQVRA